MLLFGNTEQYIRFNAILHGGVCVCQTLYWSEGSIKVDIFLNLIHAIKSLIPKITAWICNSIWQENKFVTTCCLILWLLFTGWWSLFSRSSYINNQYYYPNTNAKNIISHCQNLLVGERYASHIFYIIMTILVIAVEISYKIMLSIHNWNISV